MKIFKSLAFLACGLCAAVAVASDSAPAAKWDPLLGASNAVVDTNGVSETVLSGDWTIVCPTYSWAERGMTHGFSHVTSALVDALDGSVGVTAKVVAPEKAPTEPGHRIFMGGRFAEAAGLMPADFKDYDWGMAEKDGDLYFFGRDVVSTADPSSVNRCVLPSAIAAVRFMCDEMGVLFLMPGKYGREIPKREKLAVPTGFFRRGSVTIHYMGGMAYDYAYNVANTMIGTGRLQSYGGHTWVAACPRSKYFKTHPEYFAKNKKGEPIWGASDGCQGYCLSNPGFRQLVIDEMRRWYAKGVDICQLGQNDGAVGQCKCQACHDLYGTGDDWSEKVWLFHKGIAEEFLKSDPGKIVHILSYADTGKPPKSFRKFPSNVMIESCASDKESLARWDGYEIPHGMTFYVYNWGNYHTLGMTPKRSIEGLVGQVRLLHRYDMRGIYRCGYGEMYGMEGPQYWVYNRLIEDPKTDPKAALATYYRGTFGPAAEAMGRFYGDLEKPLRTLETAHKLKASDLVEGTVNRSRERDAINALATVYTPDRVRRMEAALTEAQRTPGLSERQLKRLQLVRTEWNYVRNIGSIGYDYNVFRDHPTKPLCEKIIAEVREREKIVARLYPDGKLRTIKDWPEIKLFGGQSLDLFKVNGRLGGLITEPLNWNLDEMEKYRSYPAVGMTPEERRRELKDAGLMPLTGFVPEKYDQTKGATFTACPGGTGFVFSQGTNGHVRVYLKVGEKQGLLPGRTYRVSWLCRWKNVDSDRKWNGLYFTGDYAPKTKEDCGYVKVPRADCHRGSSDGWVMESAILKICDKPNFTSTLCFRFWGGKNGTAEVRDFVIEEIK